MFVRGKCRNQKQQLGRCRLVVISCCGSFRICGTQTSAAEVTSNLPDTEIWHGAVWFILSPDIMSCATPVVHKVPGDWVRVGLKHWTEIHQETNLEWVVSVFVMSDCALSYLMAWIIFRIWFVWSNPPPWYSWNVRDCGGIHISTSQLLLPKLRVPLTQTSCFWRTTFSHF